MIYGDLTWGLWYPISYLPKDHFSNWCQICWALGKTFARFKGLGLGAGLWVMDTKGPAGSLYTIVP